MFHIGEKKPPNVIMDLNLEPGWFQNTVCQTTVRNLLKIQQLYKGRLGDIAPTNVMNSLVIL